MNETLQESLACCTHRWVLMSEKTERINAYQRMRRRRFYCQHCRKVAEDRDKAFAG